MRHPYNKGDRLLVAQRAKHEARRKLLEAGHVHIDGKKIGIQAKQHNTCGCWMCTYKDPKSIKQYKYKGGYYVH